MQPRLQSMRVENVYALSLIASEAISVQEEWLKTKLHRLPITIVVGARTRFVPCNLLSPKAFERLRLRALSWGRNSIGAS